MKHSPLDHYDIKWENVWSRASGMNERDEKLLKNYTGNPKKITRETAGR
jgi:hypothetical protein